MGLIGKLLRRRPDYYAPEDPLASPRPTLGPPDVYVRMPREEVVDGLAEFARGWLAACERGEQSTEADLREALHINWAGGRDEHNELPQSYHDGVDEHVDAMLALVREHDGTALSWFTTPGDELQSAASRIADWIVQNHLPGEIDYEVYMAALEAQSAVKAWTEARTGVRV